MKKIVLILFCWILLTVEVLAKASDHSLIKGTSKSREISEWTLSVSLASINKFYLAYSKPWTAKPLLNTHFKSYLDRETVSDSWIYISGFVLNTAIVALPNSNGWLNSISYRHGKGFFETALVYTPLFTSIAKLMVGKKRPYYKDDIHKNDYDARKSFWSGHASASFSIATYFNLYMYHYLGKNNNRNLLWKIPVSLLLYGAAGYVAWSRVYDHAHDELDVTVGAFVGITVSSLIFGIHDNWFGKFYHDH